MVLTIYKTAESLRESIQWKINFTYPRTGEVVDRLELLKQMVNHLNPDEMVAVDEELFKFLDL